MSPSCLWLLLLLSSSCVNAFAPPQASGRSDTFLQLKSANQLSRALAKLDRRWNIQRDNRWRKFEVTNYIQDPILRIPENKYVYLLEAPTSSPERIIVFTGGAGLGLYPHIAYNEFLKRVSDSLNAVIVTAPYAVQLDHFALAKANGDLAQRAIRKCRDIYGQDLDIFSLSHSLGAKLSMIHAAATDGTEYAGMGYISFNNFGFGKTMGMAKSFAERLPGGGSNGGIFDVADVVVNAAGIEFSPSPQEMDQIVRRRFGKLAKRSRFFSFDEDGMENSQTVFETCPNVRVSGLPGNHLTPVFFKLVPDAHSVSFGLEHELDALVGEVQRWVLGYEPARPPHYARVPLLEEEQAVLQR